jgi:hypothetical protein
MSEIDWLRIWMSAVVVGLLLLIGAVGLLWLRRSEAAEDSPG